MADRKINIRVSTTGARDVKNLGGLFTALGGAITIAVIALGALAIAAVKATKEFVKFEKSVAEIKTLALDSSKSVGDFADTLLRVKKNVPLVELNDLTAAMYKYISATGDVGGAEDALNKLGRAAIANQATIASMTDALSYIMTNFNKDVSDADDIFDKFTATIVNANSTGEKFAFVAGDMAAATNYAGFAMEDMMAVYAAGTQALNPRRVAFGWQSLTANVVANRKVFEKWGISTDNVKDMIGDLVELQGQMDAQEFAELQKNLVPDRRGMKLLGALISNYEGLERAVGDIGSAAGLTSKAYETMADTAAAKYAAIGASLEAFKLKAGELFNKIGEAFIGAFEQEDIDAILNSILATLDAIVPILANIAELIANNILTSTRETERSLTGITDLFSSINLLLGNTANDAEKTSISFKDIWGWIMAAVKSLSLAYWFGKVLDVIIRTIAKALKSWSDVLTGQISIWEHLVNLVGGSFVAAIKEITRGIFGYRDATEEAVKSQEKLNAEIEKEKEIRDKIIEGKGLYASVTEAFGEDELGARIWFEEKRGLEKGKKLWREWLDFKRRTAAEVGPLRAGDTTIGGIGGDGAFGGGIGSEDVAAEKEVADIKKSAAEIERDNIRNEWEIEKSRQQTQADIKAILQLKEDRLADEEQERKDAEDNVIKSFSGKLGNAFTNAILGSKDALKNLLVDFASTLLSKGLAKGFASLLGGLGGPIGWIASIFGAKGFNEHSGKILQLAYGGAFGAGVHKLNKATPAIIGESGPEMAAAIPLNLNGVRLVATDIIPALEQATGVKFGGADGKVQITITERASQFVDIQTAKSTTRGNRILDNDVTN